MYVQTMFGPVYVTHDRGGRPHVCPASWRLATDPEFRERVRVRGEERRARIVDVAKATEYAQRTEAR